MPRSRTPQTSALAAGLALLAVAAPGAGATQAELSPRELCQLADAVLAVEVTDVETRWAGDGTGGIERLAGAAVLHHLAGQRPGPFVTVHLPGGRIGQSWHWVEDVPALQPHAAYALFLTKHGEGWEIVGGANGAVPLKVAVGEAGVRLDAVRAALEGCDAR